MITRPRQRAGRYAGRAIVCRGRLTAVLVVALMLSVLSAGCLNTKLQDGRVGSDVGDVKALGKAARSCIEDGYAWQFSLNFRDYLVADNATGDEILRATRVRVWYVEDGGLGDPCVGRIVTHAEALQ